MMTTSRPPVIRLYEDEGCIDGFAGGGGTSTGIEMAIGRGPDIAINHDATALALHLANHPNTRHIRSNIRTVQYETVLPGGKRCGFAWFSPDCTHFSKAKGGRPFRDRQRARRIRGLAWEAVRCAKAIQPRIIFLENVEEWLDWGPIGQDGQPDPSRRGVNFKRWLRELRGLGYAVEWKQLRACDFGAPTTRKRLFVIARCDRQPIVWPEPTHGPKANGTTVEASITGTGRYRTAAECMNFDIPVPSIFMTQAQAKRWAEAHGLEPPRRPLAVSTLRRIARGVQRFVLDTPEPFIIRFNTEKGEDVRGQRLDKPITTLDTSNRFALVVPSLINTRNGERHGRHGEQAPRVYDINQPMRTVTAHGSQGALVAAFLAKHNGGHEATGQRLTRPTDTVVCRENKALVTSHLVKLRGEPATHPNSTSQDLRQPMPTVTAQGNHYAEVRAFLVKYYGTKKDGRPLTAPCDTITTKDRFALATVTLDGETYAVVDIGMRMLTPRELFNAQGFPRDYEIDRVHIETPIGLMVERPLTKRDKTRLCGNSVPPHLAAALISANLAGQPNSYKRVGNATPVD